MEHKQASIAQPIKRESILLGLGSIFREIGHILCPPVPLGASGRGLVDRRPTCVQTTLAVFPASNRAVYGS